MVKDLTQEQLTPGLKTEIVGLGHYQQEISVQVSTIMPYIEHFGLWPDQGLEYRRKSQLI
jgi:hypothetical protein